MKKIFLGILGAIFCIFSAQAEIDAGKAESFVKNLTRQGIEELINSDVSKQEKDARFYKLFNENLDLNKIGQFVLGRYWRAATPAQRTEFIDVYRKLNVKTWSARFDEFKGKNFVFKGATPLNSKGADSQIFVDTEVPMEEGKPAKVVWRVENGKNGYKIVDIIIENVSLAISARNEYTAVIQKSPNGIDDLIAELKAKL